MPSTEPACEAYVSDVLRAVSTIVSRSVFGRALVDHGRRAQDLGQAPVHHLHFAEAADHHVVGLEVAMDHAPGVRIGHRLADRLEDREEAGPVVHAVAARLEQGGEGVALHQLHGEEGPPVVEAAQLVDGHDPRVLQLPADLGLLDESADQPRIVAVLLEQDLHGQVPAEVGVAAFQNGAHAAPGDLSQELVAPRAPGRRRASPARRDGPRG